MASAFVKESKNLNGENMVTKICGLLGLADDTPLAASRIAATIFALDPLCLIHGVFSPTRSGPANLRSLVPSPASLRQSMSKRLTQVA